MGGKHLNARDCGLLVSLVALTACHPSRSPDVDSSHGALTFNKDIAPILFEHCGSCHRRGDPAAAARTSKDGVPGATVDDPRDQWCIAGAPFSLVEYRDVQIHASQVASATRRRSMPPWLPEPGYGEFTNTRRLRDDQVEMIQRWVAQGAVEGDPADRPRPPAWPNGWQLGEPDLVVTMPQPYTLGAGGADVFRNFVVPVGLSSMRYVRALEFRTDNPRILHHATISVDPARVARKLDQADPEPGRYFVFGGCPVQALFGRADRGFDLLGFLALLPRRPIELTQAV